MTVHFKMLLKIFENRSLYDIETSRLRNLNKKILHYYFKMVHLSGQETATALSITAK